MSSTYEGFDFHGVHGTQLVTDSETGEALGWISMGKASNGTTVFVLRGLDGHQIGRAYDTHAGACDDLVEYRLSLELHKDDEEA